MFTELRIRASLIPTAVTSYIVKVKKWGGSKRWFKMRNDIFLTWELVLRYWKPRRWS